MSRRSRFSGAFFFGAVGLFALSLAGLSAYESYAIAAAKEPITDYVKNEIRKQPMWADLVLLAAGILIGHFWSSAPAEVIKENNQ